MAGLVGRAPTFSGVTDRCLVSSTSGPVNGWPCQVCTDIVRIMSSLLWLIELRAIEIGANERVRTAMGQIHNLGLCWLSYVRHSGLKMVREVGIAPT